MTDEERMLVKKLHLEGMGSRKISRRTGLSENTVKSFLRRRCSRPEDLAAQTAPEIPAVQELTIPDPGTFREEDVAMQEYTDADVIPSEEPEVCPEETVDDYDPADSQDGFVNEPEICKEETGADWDPTIMAVVPFALTDILPEEAVEPVNREDGDTGLCLQCGNPICPMSCVFYGLAVSALICYYAVIGCSSGTSEDGMFHRFCHGFVPDGGGSVPPRLFSMEGEYGI